MNGIEAHLRTTLGHFALNVEIEVAATGVTGLFGASGSGKTTVLRSLAGFHRAESGFVRINGTVWQDESTGVFVPVHQRGVGYVAQEADLFPHLSVRDNLGYAERRAPEKGANLTRDAVVELP